MRYSRTPKFINFEDIIADVGPDGFIERVRELTKAHGYTITPEGLDHFDSESLQEQHDNFINDSLYALGAVEKSDTQDFGAHIVDNLVLDMPNMSADIEVASDRRSMNTTAKFSIWLTKANGKRVHIMGGANVQSLAELKSRLAYLISAKADQVDNFRGEIKRLERESKALAALLAKVEAVDGTGEVGDGEAGE